MLFAKSLTIILLYLSLLQGCGSNGSRPRPQTDLAQVIVNRVPGLDYDEFALSLTPMKGTSFALPRKIFAVHDGRLALEVPAGTYGLLLELLKGGQVVVSSAACSVATRVETYVLIPGPNSLDVPVCPQGGKDGGINGQGGTFSIQAGRLVDPSGKPFVMRGVNTPQAYYLKESNAALPRIKALGFNTVRIVWCADTLIRFGRCETKDIHPVTELEKTLAALKKERLVAVLNLQNATGSDSVDDLAAMVAYLTRPDVKQILMAYQDHLLINIANEWYGTWDKTPNYLAGYRTAVKNLRNAGLPHVLIVDARGYGQDASSIVDYGRDLMALDPNLQISAHLYDVFRSPESVVRLFDQVRSQKLPFLIGEFSCSHGVGKPVACETIMAEASRRGSEYGYIGWSYAGNDSSLNDLDVVDLKDWTTLTAWGRILVNGVGGIRATSKEACSFQGSNPCAP